jgi:DNA-binding response OmpR family regulator
MAKRIGELLVEAEVLTQAQLDQVLDRQKTEGEDRIASEIYSLGLAHEQALCQALARLHGTPAIVLSASVIDLGAVGLLPRILAERHGLLPVAIDEDTLTLAVPDEDVGPIIEQVQFASGRQVVTLIGVKKIVEDAIGPTYDAAHRGDKVLAGHQAAGTEPHLTIVADTPGGSVPPQVVFAQELVEATAGTSELDQLAPVFDEASAPVATPESTIEFDAADVIDEEEVGPPAAGQGPDAADDAPARAVPIAQIELKRVPVVRPAHPPSTVAAAPTPTDVVLAEDDDAIAELIAKVATHDGFEVQHAASGDAAVELLRRFRPRLILLDAMLPGVHGFEICARAKGSETFKDTPIVMISAVYKGWEQQRDIQEVHGADAFVEKPFDIQFLRKLIAGYLGNAIAREPIDNGAAQRIEQLRVEVKEGISFGNLSGADLAARQWVGLDPFDGEAYLEVGNVAAQRGDLPEALKAYEFAVVYAPRSFAARTNLAMVYERMGFIKRAIRTWNAAASIAPDDATRQQLTARASGLSG